MTTLKQLEDILDHNEATAAADPLRNYPEWQQRKGLDRLLADIDAAEADNDGHASYSGHVQEEAQR